MKKTDVIKEIGRQLGRVPTAQEVLLLCDKPSIINAVKNSKKFNNVKNAVDKYKKRENQSWYAVLEEILNKNPKLVGIRYRGTEITNKELVDKVERTASKLYDYGVRPGDKIAVCMSDTPEYIYVKCALNLIGAVCNSFASNYSPSKIQEIIDGCSEKVLLATDREYKQISNQSGKFNRIVLNSLKDSLSDKSFPPKEYDEKLRKKLEKYYHYESEVDELKAQDSRIVAFETVVSHEKDNKTIELLKKQKRNHDEICSITYTSGSTSHNPKGLLHTNSSVVTSAIRHLPEVTGSQPMKGMTSLFNIHSDSNTGNITQMLDILFQEGTVAPEPEYDLDSFLDVLYINKPNIAASTTSLFIEAAKQAKEYYKEGIHQIMPWLIAPTAVGEGLSNNEQKFLDSFLHFVKAGKGFKLGGIIIPIPIVMSVGGGDCERGGIFFTVFKKLQDLKCQARNREKCGLIAYPDSKLAVLDPNTLEELSYGQTGLIVSSPTESTFVGYNEEIKKQDRITDKYGRTWCMLNLEGRIKKNGSVDVFGRYNGKTLINETSLSLNELNNELLKIKSVFSCSTIKVKEDNEEYIVINYILCKTDEDRRFRRQITVEEAEAKAIQEIRNKILTLYPSLSLDRILLRRIKNRFPVTGSCKRNIRELEKLGFEDTISLNDNPMRLLKV